MFNAYRVRSPGVKWPGRGVDQPPPFSAEITERVKLYLYSPSGFIWSATRWDLVNSPLLPVGEKRICISSQHPPRLMFFPQEWKLSGREVHRHGAEVKDGRDNELTHPFHHTT